MANADSLKKFALLIKKAPEEFLKPLEPSHQIMLGKPFHIPKNYFGGRVNPSGA
jgi:hypothetical protein